MTIDSMICYQLSVRTRHRRILDEIFKRPTASNIRWDDIESLLRAAGAIIEEGAGSRVIVKLNDRVAVFHRPHPRKETDRGSVRSVERFLNEAGISPHGNQEANK